MDLTAYRDEFPTLDEVTYLNTCSLGCISERSMAAAREFESIWRRRGASAWYDVWWDKIETLRGQVADVIGADPGEVAWLPNVSVGLGSIAHALDYGERDEVVVSEMDFPTQVYPWTTRDDVTVRWAGADHGVEVPAGTYAEAISERTRLVATSRVFFTSGYIVDVEAVADRAHDAGALMLVDDYQGTGQVPIDVHETGIDVMVGGSLKWLLGGIGSCFMYVREGLHERLEPGVVGWFGNEEMFDFDPRDFRFRPNARRFETGEINLPSVYYASAGLEIVQEIGPKRLREATLDRATDLIERLDDAGFELAVPDDPDRRTGIVMVEMADAPEATEFLTDRDIVVDHRPGRLRISPYFYNTHEDNAEIVEALLEGGFGG